MIYGTMTVSRVTEESVCRSCEQYQFTSINEHKIHSTTLMPNISFGSPMTTYEAINPSVFCNSDDYKLLFPGTVACQNYITTKFVGVLPYEDYDDGHYTPAGTKFTLICRNGNLNKDYRVFGSADGVHGYGTTGTVKNTTDGLTPALPKSDGSRKFLRGDGTWVVPKEHELDP